MYCPNCGTLNDDDALFCSECGTSLAEDQEWVKETEEEDSRQTEAVENQDAAEKKTSQRVFSFGKYFTFTMTEMTVLVGMVALMLVSVIGGCIIIFADSRTDSNQAAQEEQTEQTEQAEQGELLQMEEPEESKEEEKTEESAEDIKENAEENVDYLVPDADTRYYTSAELSGFTKDQLRLARNEIYARHGRMFNDAELQAYFDSKPWYNGTIQPDDFDESIFNKYEKENINLIKSLEGQ